VRPAALRSYPRFQREPLSGSETERVFHCSVEPLDRGVLRAAAEGERLRRLLLAGGLRSHCISGPSFALRALGWQGLPVSNWASRSILDSRALVNGNKARHVVTNDLGEVPGVWSYLSALRA
jgi:hypothetical protein